LSVASVALLALASKGARACEQAEALLVARVGAIHTAVHRCAGDAIPAIPRQTGARVSGGSRVGAHGELMARRW